MKAIQLVQLREPRWAHEVTHSKDKQGVCRASTGYWLTDLVVLGVDGTEPCIVPVDRDGTIVDTGILREPEGLTEDETEAGEAYRHSVCYIHNKQP